MSDIHDDYKGDLAHIEGLEPTNSKTFTAVHMSKTLKSMPMAPQADTLAAAVQLAEDDKVQSFGSAFRNEITGLLFCLAYVLPALGQGLDSGVSSISVNMPKFLIEFGEFNVVTKSLFMPSLWLALWNASSSLGNAIGSFITGGITDRFGYKKAQLMGCMFSIGVVFLQVFAVNRGMILAGKLLNGISMGMFVAVSAGYISEVAGPRTRGTIMSVLAASPILGIISGVGIGSNAKIIGNVTSDWGSWKLIFAIQWIFPALAIVAVLLAPESPIQLVKQGRPEAALQSLKRIRPSEDAHLATIRLATTQLAVASSIDEAKSQTSTYLDCFKGSDRKRTLTVIVLLCGNQLSGTALLSNGLYFLAQTGIAFSTVSSIALAFLGISAIACISTSSLLEKVGRRNTLIYGSFVHVVLMVIVGGMHYLNSESGKTATAVLFNLAISTASIATSAPVYALIIEISSVRLRSKTQSLGFAAYYICGWVFLFAVPYMYQAAPEGAGWGVRACWLFAGFTLLFAIYSFFYVGETKGKSYADIDELYNRGISPRKFKETVIHAERDAIA